MNENDRSVVSAKKWRDEARTDALARLTAFAVRVTREREAAGLPLPTEVVAGISRCCNSLDWAGADMLQTPQQIRAYVYALDALLAEALTCKVRECFVAEAEAFEMILAGEPNE